MTSELYIENYQVDLNTDLASLVTFAIDDIKNFASRQTTFSKTIILPGSAKNNKILGNIFEVGSSNDYDPDLPNVGINFNASASANCIYFQDNIQAFKGSLRILTINIYRGKIEYEVAIAGDLSTFNARISAALLEDLDFSTYNLIWNATNIAASWDNQGSDVYFPLIDYGNYSTDKHDWKVGTFRPALFVKEYIDKIFLWSGFRYSSALFETDRFKSLIVPYNRKELTKKSTNILYRTSPTTTHDGDIDPDDDIIFSGDITTFDFTTADDITFEYTGSGFTGDINLRVIGAHSGGTGNAIFTLYVNGSPVATTSQTGSFDTTITYSVSLSSGDTISAAYSILPHRTLTVRAILTVGSTVAVDVPAELGDTLVINDCIPKNIKQVDFLVSIVKLFNLYITEDKFDNRLLNIEPYVDFYSEESQNAVDWTYKLDRSQNISIQPMSEINAKIYNFNYAKDSDYYNDLYQKRYNQSYSSYLYDTEFEFVNQSTNIDIIFAGSPLVGYAGEDKVYTTIFKLNDDVEESIDSVIRVLQTLKVTGVTDWDLKSSDGGSTLNTYDYYGYAGHLDDPDAPTNDIGFGVPAELFFILVSGDLSVNQFNVYWSPYMAEITDKDSKMLRGKLYLTPKDIQDLDFSKYVNIDGNLFRINKLIDYNMTKPDLCGCELLKVINTLY